MVICVECNANDLHMVKLTQLPPNHLLLHQNIPALTYISFLEKLPLQSMVVIVVFLLYACKCNIYIPICVGESVIIAT